MIKDGIVYVDNTTLKQVARCSSETVLRAILGWTTQEEKATLLSGSAGHEALASYFRAQARGHGKDVCIDTGMHKLEHEYKEWAEAEVPEDDRLGWPNVRAIVAEWMETRWGRLPFQFKHPDDVEVGFAYPLDEEGEFVFYGRMDGKAYHLMDDSWVVAEHKFTGNMSPFWVRQWKLDSQVTGYLWAAQQHYGDVSGVMINAIELGKLPSSERQCRTHGMLYSKCSLQHVKAQLIGPITRTPEQFEEWRLTALMLARKYKELSEVYTTIEHLPYVRMTGCFSGACRLCDFYDFCSLGRPVHAIPTMLKYAPWRPFIPNTEEGK